MTAMLHSVAKLYFDYIYRDAVSLRTQAQIACLENLKPSVFLDCGCHAGRNTLRAAHYLHPDITIGLEYGAFYALQSKDRGIKIVQTDLNSSIPLSTNSVDVITAFDVLEHLVETWSFIQELHRVLRPGGYLIIDSPNLASWHNVFALVLGIQPFSGPHLISMAESDMELVRTMHRTDHGFAGNDDVKTTSANRKMYRHIVVVAYRSLTSVLRRANFTIERTWSFGYYPLPPLLARLFCKIDPNHAHHYVIKARKSAW